MSRVPIQSEFLSDVARLIMFANSLGLQVTGGELQRTVEQQALYVKTGRSKTMNSGHIKKLAIDLFFFRDGRLTYDTVILRPVADYWKSLNPKNEWGGDWKSFKDVPHFERKE